LRRDFDEDEMRQKRFVLSVDRSFWVVALLVLVTARAFAQTAQPPVPVSAAAAVPANAGSVTVSLDPAQSKINWTLGSTLHTVHGTFVLKRGTLKFDPASGSASGEIVADATSGQTGNDSRDKKMHSEILESGRYGELIFRPDRVDGKVLAQGACNVELHGTFVLHGGEHELSVPLQAELNGNQWKGKATFNVPYVQWGLKSPNTFFLKADPAVQVELELSGTLQGVVAP
jgi:polyisoprenoid-binding protein YceI